MRYKAVLFDLDGTLLDTIEDLTAAMNAALKELDCPPRTVDECNFLVGAGLDNFARRALPESRRDERTIARCMSLMRKDYAGRWTTKTVAYDGIDRLLAGLGERGARFAVLSNKPHDFTRAMVAHFFGETGFEAVLGVRDGIPPKPDPTAARGIADDLRIAPGEFLYLGDTDIDMQTANAAGMYAVGATWGFRPREELIANGAKAIIDRPIELLPLLEQGCAG